MISTQLRAAHELKKRQFSVKHHVLFVDKLGRVTHRIGIQSIDPLPRAGMKETLGSLVWPWLLGASSAETVPQPNAGEIGWGFGPVNWEFLKQLQLTTERLAQKLVKKHGRFRVTKTCSVAATGTAQSGSWVGSTM